MDRETESLLTYVQDVVNAIPQDEFPDLSPQQLGTRLHLVSELLTSVGVGSPYTDAVTGAVIRALPAGTRADRLAAEVVVDVVTGVIVGIGIAPEKAGGLSPEKGRYKGLDIVIFQEGVSSSMIDPGKTRADEVIEIALDYKTGNGAMDRVRVTVKAIAAPYIKVVKGGDVAASARRAFSTLAGAVAKTTDTTGMLPSTGSRTVLREAAALRSMAKSGLKLLPFVGFGITLATYDPNDPWNLGETALEEALWGETPFGLVRDVVKLGWDFTRNYQYRTDEEINAVFRAIP